MKATDLKNWNPSSEKEVTEFIRKGLKDTIHSVLVIRDLSNEDNDRHYIEVWLKKRSLPVIVEITEEIYMDCYSPLEEDEGRGYGYELVSSDNMVFVLEYRE